MAEGQLSFGPFVLSPGKELRRDGAAVPLGHRADWPGARYWRELAAYYPDAKIILTVRDPDEWYDSVSATILKLMDQRGQIDNPHVSGLVDMAHALIEIGEFNGRIRDRDYAISVFNKRIADVQAAFSASRLLTLDVAEGWEPLCKFLDVPVPAISFPRLNSSRQFTQSEWKDEIATAVCNRGDTDDPSHPCRPRDRRRPRPLRAAPHLPCRQPHAAPGADRSQHGR